MEGTFTHTSDNLVRLTDMYLKKSHSLIKQGLKDGEPDMISSLVNIGKACEMFDLLKEELVKK